MYNVGYEHTKINIIHVALHHVEGDFDLFVQYKFVKKKKKDVCMLVNT